MADSLSKYRSMRDFKASPEPRGQVKKTKGRLYIIQKHDATRLHYDFRLELDGVLLSWAVTRGPSLNPADKRLAVHVEDHPVAYGGFEGVIPSGYGAGTVMLWDRGEWAPQGDPHAMLKKGNFKFVLMGERLKGGFALIRMKPRPGEKSKHENWLLIKERDPWADDSFVATEEWETSIKTGRDLARIAAKGEAYKRGKTYKATAMKQTKREAARTSAAKKPRPKARSAARRAAPRHATPKFVAPQLATLDTAPPEGDGWLHEVKFDGYRIITVIKGGKVQLWTRNQKNWTHKYQRIADDLAKLKLTDAVLDGELVALNATGKESFSMMSAAAEDESVPLVYYLFDLLNLEGEDLTDLPLIERKARLEKLLKKAPKGIRYSSHIDGDGGKVIASACRLDMEGVISKRADAPYTSGRGLGWIKSKCIGSDEFVIGGYRLSDKSGRAFRSLLLGEFKGGKLVYCGRVGTGFNDELFQTLTPRLEKLTRKTSPFADEPPEARRNAVWVQPRIVAQIAYLETTPDGHLRHPSFLGLREDKPAKEVKVAKSAPARVRAAAKTTRAKPAKSGESNDLGVRLTSPDKVLWPEAGITKHDLAEYYAKHAKLILPHLKDRPLSLVRCPEGREGECFFQKHTNPSTPDVIETVPIREKDGSTAQYLVVRTKEALIATAQIGAMELHVWGSRADKIENPERLVFDLDPDEGLDFADVRSAAAEVRDVLDSLGLKSFALLTGGKGVHVIAPIARRNDWTEVKAFCHGLAGKLAAASPRRYVATMAKKKRTGRIFIDYLRNERGSTAIVPYSLRRRPNAPVATPVTWQELKTIKSADAFTLATIDKRLKAKPDPWKGYFALKQSLSQAAIKAVS
jgi:bifunctional non-homologous end joining protein LigD